MVQRYGWGVKYRLWNDDKNWPCSGNDALLLFLENERAEPRNRGVWNCTWVGRSMHVVVAGDMGLAQASLPATMLRRALERPFHV